MDKNHLVEEEGEGKSLNFIEQIIEEELAEGKNGGRVHTRFPPEPNGYLHIGHATSICLNFGLATEYHGKCNLRFDDTNPSKEDVEYIDSIQQDIQWLGFQWEGEPHFASDYFQQLYDWAEKLILEGKAYVDDQPAEVISAQRMTPTEPGVNSPYRDRTPEENLDLFRRMKSGEFQAGEKVLRAKIDMASSNMLMRDLGSIQAPMNAFLLNLGLETLHLRMPQHCKNAQQVAEWLEANEQVAWVNFPGLKSNKYYELAQKYMPNGTCGVIAFGLKGSREDAIRFMDNLKMICIVTHVADARTCVLHPASHTHRQLTDEQLIEAGVAPDLIRLSVGIENANDIIADIEQALK